ncbi:MAG: PAS domain S-box protein [Symploca sp. SIO2E9]|nr:PAS domain S-box protein [Symploca sp. SIO2E9]
MTSQDPWTPVSLPALRMAMISHPLTVKPDTPLVSAIAQMSQAQTSCVLVVEGQCLIGILTERDLVRLIASEAVIAGVTIDTVMTRQVTTLTDSDDQDLFSILNLMRKQKLRYLPVVDATGNVVGLITPKSLREVLNPTDLLKFRLVEEVITEQVIHASGDASLLQLVQLMAQEAVSCVVICHSSVVSSHLQLKPVGIITERDIVQFQHLGVDFYQTQAQMVMSAPLLPIKLRDSLWVAHEQMKQHYVRRLVVCGEQGELVGLITQSSILQALEPAEIYSVTRLLQQEVQKLQSENQALLQERNLELEKQVEQKTTQVQQINEHDRLLSSIALRIRQSLHLEEILNTTVTEVRQLLQNDRVIIYRFDPNWSGIVSVESVSNNQWSLQGRVIRDACFEQEWLNPYQRGHARVIEDIYTSKLNPCHLEFLAHYQVRANLVVPILLGIPEIEEAGEAGGIENSHTPIEEQKNENKAENRLWGLLIAHQCSSSRQWKPSEIDFLQKLATQVAIAIQQATLVEQLQTQLAISEAAHRERQQSQEALQESESTLRSFFDSSPMMLGIVELVDDDILHISDNVTTARFFGLTPEAMRNRLASEMGVPQQHLRLWMERYGETERTQSPVKFEYLHNTVDGQKWLSVIVSSIPVSSDSSRRFAYVVEDITKRKQIKEDLHQAYRELEQRNFELTEVNEELEVTLEELRVNEEELRQHNQELARIQQSLATQRQQYQDLFNFAPDGYLVTDTQGIIQEANSSVASQLNLEQQFLIGKPLINYIFWQEHQTFLNKLNQFNVKALQTSSLEQVQTWELNLWPRESKRLPVAIRISAVQEYDQLVGFRWLIRDITERKQAEAALKEAKVELEVRVAQRTAQLSRANERLQYQLFKQEQTQVALRESQKRYATLAEVSPVGIFRTDIRGNCLYVNERWCEIAGLTLEQSLARGWVSAIHRDDREQVFNEWHLAVHNSLPFRLEYRFQRPDGAVTWVFGQALAQRDPQGGVTGFVGTITDITQLKRTEANLLESERRWRTLLEQVRLLVIGLDQNGKVEYANPFFLELTGYTQTEVLGKDWLETFVPLSEQQQVQTLFQALLPQDFTPYYQNSILTKYGEERIIAWNNTLLQNPSGEAIGIMSIGEDITERYAIARMKDEFISVVSHELRTPLTSIHGALKLLSSGLIDSKSERGERVIAIATESAEHLVRLVNDILELERLESGKIRLSKQQVNAADLMITAVEQMRVMANRGGISLEVAPQAIEFTADFDRIIQVLTNLLGNAIKFSPQGSTVWLSVQQQAVEEQGRISHSPIDYPQIRFQVKDQGRGIPADKIESIFERFHQVDASDSRKKGGTGLGLAICRSIVEQHGGKIWADSTVGEGSSFYFTLPIQIGREENNDSQTRLSN